MKRYLERGILRKHWRKPFVMLQPKESDMTLEDFAQYVSLVGPVVYHGGTDVAAKCYEVLTHFDCPKEWMPPIIVMAEGGYLGHGVWLAKYVGAPWKREDWMEEDWKTT